MYLLKSQSTKDVVRYDELYQAVNEIINTFILRRFCDVCSNSIIDVVDYDSTLRTIPLKITSLNDFYVLSSSKNAIQRYVNSLIGRSGEKLINTNFINSSFNDVSLITKMNDIFEYKIKSVDVLMVQSSGMVLSNLFQLLNFIRFSFNVLSTKGFVVIKFFDGIEETVEDMFDNIVKASQYIDDDIPDYVLLMMVYDKVVGGKTFDENDLNEYIDGDVLCGCFDEDEFEDVNLEEYVNMMEDKIIISKKLFKRKGSKDISFGIPSTNNIEKDKSFMKLCIYYWLMDSLEMNGKLLNDKQFEFIREGFNVGTQLKTNGINKRCKTWYSTINEIDSCFGSSGTVEDAYEMNISDNIIIETNSLNEQDLKFIQRRLNSSFFTFIVCHEKIDIDERFQAITIDENDYLNIIYLSWMYSIEYKFLIDTINDIIKDNINEGSFMEYFIDECSNLKKPLMSEIMKFILDKTFKLVECINPMIESEITRKIINDKAFVDIYKIEYLLNAMKNGI